MLTIHLSCVGKLKERFYLDAAAEYQKRLGGLCRFQLTELPEARLPDRPSPAQIRQGLEREGAAIRERLPRGGVVVALCVEGKPMSSEALAAAVDRWQTGGSSTLTFLIGGSYGLDPSVKALAQLRLSMSPMTFPHHLARIMVLEQLYRALQINAGTSYHK